MNGIYKVKNSDMKSFVKQVFHKIEESKIKFKIKHIPRELNTAADKLSKKGARLVKE